MNKYNFDWCFERLIDVEGGYVNDIRDNGGATKYGITIFTLEKYRKVECTVGDVQDLTLEEAKNIYRDWYWNPCKLENFESCPLSYLMFDQNVNRGLRPTSKTLQTVMELPVDGIIGPNTISVMTTFINTVGTKALRDVLLEFVNSCQDSYCRIVAKEPKNVAFIGGWINRTQELNKIVIDWYDEQN